MQTLVSWSFNERIVTGFTPLPILYQFWRSVHRSLIIQLSVKNAGQFSYVNNREGTNVWQPNILRSIIKIHRHNYHRQMNKTFCIITFQTRNTNKKQGEESNGRGQTEGQATREAEKDVEMIEECDSHLCHRRCGDCCCRYRCSLCRSRTSEPTSVGQHSHDSVEYSSNVRITAILYFNENSARMH